MSSILKALKKLEHDKITKRPDSLRIDAEILHGGSTNRYNFTGIVLAALILFLSGVGASYLFIKHEIEPVSLVHSPQMPNEKTKNILLTRKLTFPVSSRSVEGLKPPSSETSVYLSEKKNSTSQSIEKKNIPQKAKFEENVPQTSFFETKPLTPTLITSPKTASIKPEIKVNGIAYQDGVESFAVINGIAVSKGSVIEGARIEEIQKDRVNFNRGGEKFEVFLDKSN